MSLTLKIAIVGPRQAGKTKIVNMLSGLPLASEPKYDPTEGVRIVELERDIEGRTRDGSTQNVSVNIELWDCSGDQKFESCWPAIMRDLHGICVVFDPKSKSQANDVRIWCEWFCKNAELQNDQCVIFAHGDLTKPHQPLPVKAGESRTVSVPIVNVSTGEHPTTETEFIKFVNGVYGFHPSLNGTGTGTS